MVNAQYFKKKNNAGKGTIPFYNYTMVIKQELNKVSVDTMSYREIDLFRIYERLFSL